MTFQAVRMKTIRSESPIFSRIGCTTYQIMSDLIATVTAATATFQCTEDFAGIEPRRPSRQDLVPWAKDGTFIHRVGGPSLLTKQQDFRHFQTGLTSAS